MPCWGTSDKMEDLVHSRECVSLKKIFKNEKAKKKGSISLLLVDRLVYSGQGGRLDPSFRLPLSRVYIRYRLKKTTEKRKKSCLPRSYLGDVFRNSKRTYGAFVMTPYGGTRTMVHSLATRQGKKKKSHFGFYWVIFPNTRLILHRRLQRRARGELNLDRLTSCHRRCVFCPAFCTEYILFYFYLLFSSCGNGIMTRPPSVYVPRLYIHGTNEGQNHGWTPKKI